MSKISVMPQEIATWLSQQSVLKEARFLTEFPAIKKEIPLKRVTVAVGIENLKLEDSFTQNNDGVLVENEYCRLATIKINLGIHVPFKLGGAKCHDILTKVIDMLTFKTDLNVLQSGCGEIFADRNTDAFVLDAYVLIGADFCPADSTGMNFHSFLDKELLCGSHIRDNVIHVAQSDKDYWNAPYVFNAYFGTGTTTRSVTLGFKPNFLIVFACEHPATSWDYNKKLTVSHIGIASPGGSTVGIALTSTGFRLNSAEELGDGYSQLNEAGYTYIYMAFKPR